MILFEQNSLGAILRIVLSLAIIFAVFVYLMIWGERRFSAWMQDRLGPNRVGPFGLFQGIADAFKFLFKEEIRPKDAHPVLFYVAPFMALFPAVLTFAVIPYGVARIDGVLVPLQIANINVGILWVLSISSLGVFSVILAGLSAGSKYPMFGALRAAAQVISYEIPMGLAILSVLIFSGSPRLLDIVVAQQESIWYIVPLFLGFLLFLISMFAETNRLPFDLAEGETEIIGYHAEYSSMKFSMFFMAEYAHMTTAACLVVLLFLGGWEFLPFFGWDQLGAKIGLDFYGSPLLWTIPMVWFWMKVAFFCVFFIWVRWTLPRFRYDQLMSLGWKRLIPLGLFNLILAIFLAYGVMP